MLFQVETTRKSWVLSCNNNNSAPFGLGSRVGPAVLLPLRAVSAPGAGWVPERPPSAPGTRRSPRPPVARTDEQ